MLKSITFGTFYFFLVFCVILLVWVFFFVPETKGVPIEEMDKIFGGNQGEKDIQRIREIRQSLGIYQDAPSSAVFNDKKTAEDPKVLVEHAEEESASSSGRSAQ
jgi:hypothetical protein